ncbi:MAG: hypothetical protein M1816_007228 [Peltula sp. TS41687]|nr:MAG: hypothetical protein M1816_007228 [Peltula sp. TS41687]
MAAIGKEAIPGVTSEGQKARVQRLRNAGDQRRQREKKMQSAKKSSRKRSSSSGY